MFNFRKADSQIVLLINFEGLAVYGMKDDVLIQHHKFCENDEGYEKFRKYLNSRNTAPVTILVDSISEDFVVESVAHVLPTDRRAMLNRKLNSHFRGIDYRSANVLMRDKKGRRDNKVLFSALTKNELIEGWINCLLETCTPVKSISSAAFALCKIVDEYELLTSNNLLLVNWEASGIRHTYIQNKQLMFSRLTPLPSDSEDDLAEDILLSCKQSKDYIERNVLLNNGNKLDVHVISPILPDNAFETLSDHEDFNCVCHHSSLDMIDYQSCAVNSSSPATALTLCLGYVLKNSGLKNIYAPSSALRFYQINQFKRILNYCCIGTVLVATIASQSVISDAVLSRDNAARLQSNLLPIQSQYQQLKENLPDAPIEPRTMALVVANYNLIEQQIRQPAVYFAAISNAVAINPAIELRNLNWKYSSADASKEFSQSLLEQDLVVSIDLEGYMSSSNSFQNSHNRILDFINTLRQIPGTTVTPVRLPIESAPETGLSAVVSDSLIDVNFTINVKFG